MTEILILIPGNPSIDGLYDDFMDLVLKKTSFDKYKVLTHITQEKKDYGHTRNISLLDVIEDHRQNIKAILSKSKTDKITIISHSLGAAIALELHESFKNDIENLIFICPFFGPREKNIKLLKLSQVKLVKSLLKQTFKRNVFSHLILKPLLKESYQREKISQELSNGFPINNVINLVSSYRDSFKVLDNIDRIKEIPTHRSYFIFVENDFWSPLSTISMLHPKAKYEINKTLSHDFCLYKNGNEEMAQRVSKALNNLKHSTS